MTVCSKDCFNCPYEDCIYDGMDAEDYAQARERDKELRDGNKTSRERKAAAYQRAYYEANKDEIAAKNRAYRARKRMEGIA